LHISAFAVELIVYLYSPAMLMKQILALFVVVCLCVYLSAQNWRGNWCHLIRICIMVNPKSDQILMTFDVLMSWELFLIYRFKKCLCSANFW